MFDGLDDWDKGQLVYLSIVLIVIVASSAALRGANLSRSLKMLFAWIAIFAIIFIAATYREDGAALLGDIRNRVTGELDPASGVATAQSFRIRAREDGHFWVRARVNGAPVLFIVDTGATDIVLSHAAARRAGIELGAIAYDRIVLTANGAVRAGSVKLHLFEVGPIARNNLSASVGERDSGANLLGMAFLRTLKGWRVEGDTLILSP